MNKGDYVRTKDGLIGKYNIKKEFHTIPMWQGGSKCQEVEQQYINDKKYNQFDYEIIKSSPNIIDLIEVGDYVNDEKIVDIGYLTNGPEKGTKVIDYYIAPNTVYYLKNEDIKSIVTKEQFSAMEYKVESEVK